MQRGIPHQSQAWKVDWLQSGLRKLLEVMIDKYISIQDRCGVGLELKPQFLPSQTWITALISSGKGWGTLGYSHQWGTSYRILARDWHPILLSSRALSDWQCVTVCHNPPWFNLSEYLGKYTQHHTQVGWHVEAHTHYRLPAAWVLGSCHGPNAFNGVIPFLSPFPSSPLDYGQ